MDLFTKMEFDDIIAKLKDEMEDVVKAELATFYRMSGVMIQMLMFEAEKQQITLEAEVSYMENYKALEELKDYENLSKLETSGGQTAFSLNPIGGKKKGNLPGMMGTMGNALMQ